MYHTSEEYRQMDREREERARESREMDRFTSYYDRRDNFTEQRYGVIIERTWNW